MVSNRSRKKNKIVPAVQFALCLVTGILKDAYIQVTSMAVVFDFSTQYQFLSELQTSITFL